MTQATPRHAVPIDALIMQGFSPRTLAGIYGVHGAYGSQGNKCRLSAFGLQGLGGNEAANLALSVSSIGASAATGTTAAAIFGAANAAWAVPVVGAAVAGIMLAIGAWINRKGPQQKILTTHIVEEAEPILIQNLDAYNAGPHTLSSQQVALANFDNVWAQIIQACSNPAYGDPGSHCISDRQRGTTHVNDQGQSFDWFKLYRDPIANDPHVVPDPIIDAFGNTVNAAGQIISPAPVATPGPSMVPLFLIAGALLVAVNL